ncbi:MAG: glycosyltransferase family 39 protein [Candidatus Omnitrophica bacterium]|nr:glycosyltransferase family 39 protein [Candidatus Omnitrophota bacterium]
MNYQKYKETILELIDKKRKAIVFLVFWGIFLIGLNIFTDYGVHYDEYANQAFGRSANKCIRDALYRDSRTSELFSSPTARHDLIHGPAFELFLTFTKEKLLKLTDSRDIIFMRHLLTFLVFYLGVFFFYLLCKFHFKSWKMGILGSLFLILHPRIFSHSFYNSVDIPFLSFYILGTYTLIRYLEKKTYPRAIFHALACAILINIRAVGVILPLSTFIFLAMDTIRFRKHKEEIRKIVKTALLYTLLLTGLVFLFCPLLWKNPIGNFFEILNRTAKFQRADTSPAVWNYHLKWIGLTTPLLYSLCFFIGLLLSIKDIFRSPIKFFHQNRTILIALFLLFVPLILPHIYKTSLYDGWRHHYFIYPIFLIFSLTGVAALFRLAKTKFHGWSYKFINTVFILIIVISLKNTVQFMVKYHPHQYVYANILAGRDMGGVKARDALDYWGLSYRKGLEYILKTDKSDKIKVCLGYGRNNIPILPANDRKRLVFVKTMDKADYFLGNYKHSGGYIWSRGDYPKQEEYYSLKFGEVKFMVVYKLKNLLPRKAPDTLHKISDLFVTPPGRSNLTQ